MADVKIACVVQRPPYKSETSTLGFTHAISSQVVEMLLEDGQNVIPTMCMVGEGIFNLLNNQKAMENYGVTSIESHGKNALLCDLDILVCKEDLVTFGIAEDRLLDAEDMGADKKLQIVPYSEIQKVMESSAHLLFF